ncbi:MAG: antibiotic biosynthesis monooxygenase family protein [Acidimicrobiales bacterium]
MIRTYLEFDVLPGKATGLADFFDRRDILRTSVAQPGCQSAELTISADGLTALVTATWDDRDAYDRWTSRSDREDDADELSSFLRQPVGPATIGRVLDVVLDGAS